MAQLADLLPAKLQDKAKAVAGALVLVAGVVVANLPAVADNAGWRIAVGVLTLLATTGAVYGARDPRVPNDDYDPQHDVEGN